MSNTTIPYSIFENTINAVFNNKYTQKIHTENKSLNTTRNIELEKLNNTCDCDSYCKNITISTSIQSPKNIKNTNYNFYDYFFNTNKKSNVENPDKIYIENHENHENLDIENHENQEKKLLLKNKLLI